MKTLGRKALRLVRVIFPAILALTGSVDLSAQTYVISTYAGGAPPATPAPGVSASIGSPLAVAADSGGNVYFAVPGTVFKLEPEGTLTRVAGNSKRGFSGDGGPATSAQVSDPLGLALDGAGNLYIADADNDRIRRVAPSGIIVTVAGGGSGGDEGPATSARLFRPSGVAVDKQGNIFFTDYGTSRIRKISSDGLIVTVAGGGSDLGDGGPASNANLDWPQAMAVDAAGNLFFVDLLARTRRISPDGIIITVAGSNPAGFLSGGCPATGPTIFASAIAVDEAGALFIANTGLVCKIYPSGAITTVAGNGTNGFSGDGGPATKAVLSGPSGIAVNGAGEVFIADFRNSRIRKISSGGTIDTVAGDGSVNFAGDSGPATDAQLNYPNSVTVDSTGNVIIADVVNNRVRRIDTKGIITTVAGNGQSGFSGDGGDALKAQLNRPAAVTVDSAGNLFVVDSQNNRVRKISASGVISTLAGSGATGDSGDGEPATSAQFRLTCAVICGGVAMDRTGNLFVSDPGNSRVRKISPDGIIVTAAGNGTAGFSGDGGPATNAELNIPSGLVVDGSGNLLIADRGNGRVRQVSPNGTITTVAGGSEVLGFSGDGGAATSARLNRPDGVAVDSVGDLLIADPGLDFEVCDAGDDPAVDHRLRKVGSDGTITTVAGNGTPGFDSLSGIPLPGFTGEGVVATAVALSGPTGVAVDSVGNLLLADPLYNVIRILKPVNDALLITGVVDAATGRAGPVSPGKIVVIYGAGLGPGNLAQNQATNGQFGTQIAGTSVSVSGIAAPMLYSSATQVAAIVPYAVTGASAQVTVSYQGSTSAAFTVPVSLSAPGIFTSDEPGEGQAAAVNSDGTLNTAANPVKIGGYVSLYATGAGQTSPAGVDGRVAGSTLLRTILPVSVTVGGIPAMVQYAGDGAGQVAGLTQINVLIPTGVQPGGYVPVVLSVGDTSTPPDAVWIAVSGN